MNNLGRFLRDTADQILSTVIIAAIIYAILAGVNEIIQNPPSNEYIYLIIGIGFFCGILRFFTNDKITNNIKNNDDMEM